MSQYVVWYDSSETGAPALNNAAGSMIGMLEACLVTGFNPRTLTSLSVSGGVATATFAGHGYSGIYGKDIDVAGAAPAALNGRKELTFVDTNTFKFAAPGVPDGAASGTITTRRSPLGWVKEFSSTNKAIFKRSDVTATVMKLRIVDDNAQPGGPFSARAVMVESATDIDTFDMPSPNSSVISQGLGYYWNKGQNTTAPKQWTLIGDAKGFYFVTQSSDTLLPSNSRTDYTSSANAFFDFPSLKQGDAYNTVLTGEGGPSNGGGTNYSSTSIGSQVSGPNAGNITTLSVARTYAQLPGPVSLGVVAPMAGGPPGNIGALPFPSPIDNGFVMAASVPFSESSPGGYAIRGFVPGFVHFLSYFPLQHQQIIGNVAALPGRKIIGLRAYSNGLSTLGFDLTGPWF